MIDNVLIAWHLVKRGGKLSVDHRALSNHDHFYFNEERKHTWKITTFNRTKISKR